MREIWRNPALAEVFDCLHQTNLSLSVICLPGLREAHLERMLFLYTSTTFPEKLNKIALFDLEKYKLE